MTANAQPSSPGPVFTTVPLSKIVVMSLCTLDLYQLFWFYAQWKAIQRSSRFEDLSPVLRAFFAPIFAFGFFERVRTVAARQHVAVPWAPVPLGIAYLLLNTTWRWSGWFSLPGWIWLLSFTKILVLLPVQGTINRMTPAAESARRPTYSAGEIVVAVVGGLVLALALVGIFLPAKS